MREQTLIILKPDAIARGLSGEVISRLEKTGLKMVACRLAMLSTSILEEHYAHLVDKPFFGDIVKYMQSGPVLIQVRDGVDAARLVRKIVGATDPAEAAPGTIRGDYALNIARNMIHASETAEIAAEEVKRFFDNNELADYARCDEAMLYELDR